MSIVMKTHLRPDPTQPNTAASGDPWNTPPVAGRTKPAHRARAVLAPCRLAAALLLAAAPTLTIPTAAANAEPPERMSYQGFLVDGAGTALAPDTPQNFAITFRIYGSSDGNDLLWAEDQVVTVDKGNFSVALGEGGGHPDEPYGDLSDLFDGVNSADAGDRYLETTVIINDREQTLLPRLRLVPSAYSFLAARAIVADSARRVELPEGAGFISDQGGSLKLGPGPGGSGNPYIDFRNGGQQETATNVRLVNDGDGQLSLFGSLSVDGKMDAQELSVTGKVDAEELSVAGPIDATQYLLNGSPLPASAWQSSGDNIFFTGGNLGIGTTDPGSNRLKLGTWRDQNGIQPTSCGLVIGDGTRNGAAIQISSNLGDGGQGLVVDNYGYGDTSTDLLLVRNNTGTGGGGPNIALSVKARAGGGSYVGIGQHATTDANLAVNGSIIASRAAVAGTITANQADIANIANIPHLFAGNVNVAGSFSANSASVTGKIDAANVNISTNLTADVISARRADIRTVNVGEGGLYYNVKGDSQSYTLKLKNVNDAYWQIVNSDSRLKRDIESVPSAVDTVSRLRGVTWHWNDLGLNLFTADVETDYRSASGRPEDDEAIWAEKRAEILEKQSKLQYGFVAQEVERVFPDWVSTGEDGYKQINMSRLNAVLVEAIKEQQADIEAQAAKIESLEKRLANLEAKDRAQAAEFAALESLLRERLGVVQQASLRVHHTVNTD